MKKLESWNKSNGSFLATLQLAIGAFLGTALFARPLSERKNKGGYVLPEVVQTFIRWLDSFGNAENQSEKDALTVKLRNDGKTELEIIDSLKSVKRTNENARTTNTVLQRIYGATVNGKTPIVPTVAKQEELIRNLNKALGLPTTTTVSEAEFSQALDELAKVLTTAKDSSVSIEMLDFVEIPAKEQIERAKTATAKA
jgi:hypothetical protein